MQRFAYIEAVPLLLVVSPAASRLAALKGLDPPELARTALRLARRLNEAVRVLKRSAPLQPHSDILTIETALWDRHSLHQRAPKTYFFLGLFRVILSFSYFLVRKIYSASCFKIPNHVVQGYFEKFGQVERRLLRV